MTLNYETYHELVQALVEHPEWRAELRPLILGEEILSLPSRMDRVEAALERLEAAVQLQGELIQKNSDDITLVARQLGILNERVNDLGTRMDSMEKRMDSMDGRMGNLEGGVLETRYRDLLRDGYRPYIVRATNVRVFDIEAVEQADEQGRLDPEQRQRLVHTDLFVAGASRTDRNNIVLACEISTTINVADVERAEASASILRELGLAARGFVGGHAITEEAQALAAKLDQIVDLRRKSG